ncbi:PfkB family carbohydrate kinase (plasmid) [Rhizobium beringeri]|uniref:PfkB family carbohydrate kinase n=1 Tax=Rhizobium beringeri TaxID=3019934 RepID=UPI002DDCAA77|nr:PfkB family carbohydrate kinase [Rhizobium beringeri]WSG92835.1 PfkB family carbohydrate kinase [Rhizobium beringeri]
MTEIDIVGGIYREKCAFPYWDQLFGSAGRAANALAGHIQKIRLHSALADEERPSANAVFADGNIDLKITPRERPVVFDYLHCLAVPKIFPDHDVKQFKMPDVTGDVIVKFGMLESDPCVTGEFVVYDPQSSSNPLSFSQSGSTAKHLAIIANRGEILGMARATSVDDAVTSLFDAENADVIVVKDGINGATVYERGGAAAHVPAFVTQNVFSIGSGDIFVAAFALTWAVQRRPPAVAADFASRSTADYVETRLLPINSQTPNSVPRNPASKAGGNIYLAGPFRELGQRMMIDDARNQLVSLGMSVFSPIHDIGPGTAEIVVRQDLAAIEQCDAVFAILNGSSPGTVFEVGYARALKKPVFCVTQNMREVDLKLPRGSEAYLHEDYVSALFQIAWRS